MCVWPSRVVPNPKMPRIITLAFNVSGPYKCTRVERRPQQFNRSSDRKPHEANALALVASY